MLKEAPHSEAAKHHVSQEAAYRDAAVEKIEALEPRLQREVKGKILSSRDSAIAAIGRELIDLIPSDFAGVKRFFLPIAPRMPKGSTDRYGAYFSYLSPDQNIQNRSLPWDALKVVISGSILHNGEYLTPGDWLWIPAGEDYAYTAGNIGAFVLTTWPHVSQKASEPLDAAFRLITAAENALKEQIGEVVTKLPDRAIKDAIRGLRGILPMYAEGDHYFMPFAPTMPPVAEKDGRYFAWVSLLEPDTLIPSHSHDMEKLADMKVLIQGTATVIDQETGTEEELRAADWLWIPAGKKYTFKVGGQGAIFVNMWPWN